MVQGASNGTNDEDDMNQPIILLKKSSGKKSTDPNTNEERTSSLSRPKEIIVYTRSRFRGSLKNGDSCDGKIHVDASGPTNRLTAPVNVGEVPAKPESTTCVNNGKQVEDQSQIGFACNDIIDTVLELAPPRKAKDATEGFSDSIKLTHQKANKVEERVKYDQLDHPPMGSEKERQFMLRTRQKARIAMRNTSVALKPQFAGVEQGHTASFLMSAPLVTAQKLSLSEPSNLNPGLGGSCSQQPTVGSRGKSLQLFPPWLFSGSGNNTKTPTERSQHIHSRESNPLVKVWFEEELDALWKGVRRHRMGNWEAIIKDPTLHFSSNKKPEHLSQKWSVEKLKALGINEEPARLPEGQPPIVAELASGKSKRRHRSMQKDSVADFHERRVENETIVLKGMFQLSDASVTGFAKANDSRNTNDQKENSSEGTISD